MDATSNADGRRLHAHLTPALAAALEHAPEEGEDAGIMFAEAALMDTLGARASDLHLDAQREGFRLRLRVDGVALDALELDGDAGQRLMNQFKTLAGLDPVSAVRPGEGRFTMALEGQELHVRVTQAPCLAGDKVAVRLLTPPAIVSHVSSLGLRGAGLQAVEGWSEGAAGMLLVTGPTGSGKTTTLYSLLEALRREPVHLITLEDPVEYELPGVNQMQVSHERGFGFADGVRAMLRLDPDYLLVGELREGASAEAAVGAAASGRAVMATLHSRDAAGVVTVLRNYGLDDFEIASHLDLVVAQRLVRRLCESCRMERPPSERELRWLERLNLPAPEAAWDAQGCEHCAGLGFQGRTGIFEVWQPADEDCSAIFAHADEHALRRSLGRRGHRFLLDDALEKAAEGLTSLSELRTLGALGLARGGEQQGGA